MTGFRRFGHFGGKVIQLLKLGVVLDAQRTRLWENPAGSIFRRGHRRSNDGMAQGDERIGQNKNAGGN